MGSNSKDARLLPDGIEKEYRILHLLERLGYRVTRSSELNEEFATNLLITGHRSLDGKDKVPPIAIQTTKQRRMRGRATRFMERAVRRFKEGPLLYLRCRGDVSLEKARSLDEALWNLWFDPALQGRRLHGLALYADGQGRWMRNMHEAQL